MPVVLTLPWGLVLGPVPAFPLPAKVTVQVCPPLDWSHLRPEDAEDPEVLDRCYAEVVEVMQTTLDELAAERPFPIVSRVRDFLAQRSG